MGRVEIQDDDESYDSYEDDDDSYDSYEDSQDSSEDEDADDEDIEEAQERIPRAVDKGDKGKTAPSVNKPFPGTKTQEEKEAVRAASLKRREEARKRWAEERARRGKKPIHEPDEPSDV